VYTNTPKALGALASRGSLRSSPSAAVLESPCFGQRTSPFQSTRFRIARVIKRARD